MHKHILIKLVFTGILLACLQATYAQGNVGIGTTSAPQEKLDVNGAMLVRGSNLSTTAGTIRWNSTAGYHEGRTSAGSWVRLENQEDYLYGDYTAISAACAAVAATGTIGSYDYNTAATGYFWPSSLENPFNTWWMNDRTQFLILASELTAAGVCPGNITSIGFIVVTPGVYAMNALTIQMKNTPTTSLTTYETGLTTVYTAATPYMPFTGNNDFAIPSGTFSWDGTSNLALDVCYDNSAWSTGCTVTASSGLAFQASGGYFQDDAFAGYSLCTIGTYASNTYRPQIRIQGPAPITVTGTDYYVKFNSQVVVGSPSIPYGATDHGAGSLNAEIVFDDNTVLSDYVFDKYYDGKVSKEDIEKYKNYRHYSIDEMGEFIEQYRHLPTIKGRADWEKEGSFSLGELLSQLWVTAEENALYIKELNDNVANAEKEIINNEDILREKYIKAIYTIQQNPYLSDNVKQIKIAQLTNGLDMLNQLITK